MQRVPASNMRLPKRSIAAKVGGEKMIRERMVSPMKTPMHATTGFHDPSIEVYKNDNARKNRLPIRMYY